MRVADSSSKVRITNVSGPVCVGIGGRRGDCRARFFPALASYSKLSRPAKEALMLIFGAVDEAVCHKGQL